MFPHIGAVLNPRPGMTVSGDEECFVQIVNRLVKRVLGLGSLFVLVVSTATAEPPAPPAQSDPSSVEDIRAALFGGVPGDRWKEGLLFDGIRPSPWMQTK